MSSWETFIERVKSDNEKVWVKAVKEQTLKDYERARRELNQLNEKIELLKGQKDEYVKLDRKKRQYQEKEIELKEASKRESLTRMGFPKVLEQQRRRYLDLSDPKSLVKALTSEANDELQGYLNNGFDGPHAI